MRKTILDFTGIYREQSALREEAEEYLDVSRLAGTDCYCDPETERSLKEMVEKMPRTEKQLLRISGVGQKKMELYGKAFLDAIADYCDQC